MSMILKNYWTIFILTSYQATLRESVCPGLLHKQFVLFLLASTKLSKNYGIAKHSVSLFICASVLFLIPIIRTCPLHRHRTNAEMLNNLPANCKGTTYFEQIVKKEKRTSLILLFETIDADVIMSLPKLSAEVSSTWLYTLNG